MKYPKLASITRLVVTAYIHTAQFVKIRKPESKRTDNFFLSFIR